VIRFLSVASWGWILLLAGAAGAQAPPAAPVAAAAPQRGQLRMALVNMRCFTSDSYDPECNRWNIRANLKRHLYFIDEAAARGAEFVGFPELSLNGYHFSSGTTWLSLDGPEVRALQAKAKERGLYVGAGLAEQDADGHRWNTHFVVDPQGRIVGRHHKIYLTDEEGYTRAGTDHAVFEVKGAKMGIAICADGTDFANLQALAKNGARIIYGPHATHNDGTTAGWYRFRAPWAGADGWIARLQVTAALHNHAGMYHAQFQPPAPMFANAGWCSGAWFIGPHGQTLARMPSSTKSSDSHEYVLMHDVPLDR
jgi:predicted amidohydrolase